MLSILENAVPVLRIEHGRGSVIIVTKTVWATLEGAQGHLEALAEGRSSWYSRVLQHISSPFQGQISHVFVVHVHYSIETRVRALHHQVLAPAGTWHSSGVGIRVVH